MDQMQHHEIVSKIDGKTFLSDGFSYTFNSGNTLIVNNNPSSSFRYELKQEGGITCLVHNGTFGTEDLVITPIKKHPFEFMLTFKDNKKVLGIWVEKI